MSADAARSVTDSAPLLDHPRYRTVKDLNSGTTGFVQLVWDEKDGIHVAIKFVVRGSAYLSRAAEREILNHRLLSGHPHIVQFREVFLTSRYLCIVMEFVTGGDLADVVDLWNMRNRKSHVARSPGEAIPHECMPEELCRKLFQQLLVAVEFCHSLGIANRDIKLENVLLIMGNVDVCDVALKLCDFGYSKDELVESMSKTLCGTPEYIAPEVLILNCYQGKISDIWSCGVLLYVMLTGVFPFWRKEDDLVDSAVRLHRMFPRIVAADYPPPQHLSPDACDLVSHLLTADTNSRYTVADAMKHPWVCKGMPSHLVETNSRLLAMTPQDRIRCMQSETEIRNLIHTAAGARQALPRHPSRSSQDAIPGAVVENGSGDSGMADLLQGSADKLVENLTLDPTVPEMPAHLTAEGASFVI